MNCLSIGLLSICLALSIAAAVEEESMPTRSPTESIDELRSRETFDRQAAHTAKLIAWHRAQIEKTEDDGDRDDLEDFLEVLEFAGRLQAGALANGLTEGETFEINTLVDRILDLVENPIDSIEVDPFQMFRSVYLGPIFGHATPNLEPDERNQPIGIKQAEIESAYLFDPQRDRFYTPPDLAELTSEAIAALDVSPRHPGWLTRSEIEKHRGSRLTDFRTEHLRGIKAEAIRDGDLKPGQSYEFGASQRVLFLEEVYQNAASPKCRAEDAHGIEWKLKWADETQVEPVVGALYLLAGARQTDFSFVAGPGADELVLILNHPDPEKRKKDKDDERYPHSYETFNQAMIDFYGIDMGVFVLDRGVVTKENADQLLRHLPPGAIPEYRKEAAIGREWITFKQTLLELRPKGYIRRVDGARLSDLLAESDRAARGSFLFNLWVANRDAKDNNHKSYFTKENDEIVAYHEGHHDLGLSLGPLLRAGELSAVTTGTDFARKGALGRKWRFPIGLIFKPDAWHAATWSDMKWMADRIVAIRESEIRAAVAMSRWPDFNLEALTYKLRARQYRIAEMYGLTDAFDGAAPTPPTIAISLASENDIKNAENRYDLPAGSLREILIERGWVSGSEYRETLVSAGEVTRCRDSALIAALVKHRYPSGLAERYERGRKGTPPECAAR